MNPEVNFITANVFIIKQRQNVTSFVSKYQCGKYCLCSKYVLNQYIDNKSPYIYVISTRSSVCISCFNYT